MPSGGIRTGAGRPQGSKSKNTLEQEAIRSYIFEEVKRNKKQIVESLIQEATNGEITAIKELLDRAIGKTKDRLEMEGEIQPILVLPTTLYNKYITSETQIEDQQ